MNDAVRLNSFPADGCAVVVGASGGLGGAFVDLLGASGAFAEVVGLDRRGGLDLQEEASIARAAAALPSPPRLVIVATGVLHDEDLKPEKALSAVTPDALARAFAVNATGPVLVAKHFTPLFPKTGKAAFAALSARVGSIGDNRLGGWHAYRASKAALNMLVRTVAIELARTRPEAVCLCLHPGTVETALSRPFRPGGGRAGLFTPAESAATLLGIIDRHGPEDSGAFLDWTDSAVPW